MIYRWLVVIYLFGAHLWRRVQPPLVRPLPSLQPRDSDARTIRRRQVEHAEYVYGEQVPFLMGCERLTVDVVVRVRTGMNYRQHCALDFRDISAAQAMGLNGMIGIVVVAHSASSLPSP